MIKKLNISKKLTAIALSCTMVFMGGCSKEQEQKAENYSTIYMTEYDSYNHELYWDEKTQNELDGISKDIIAVEEVSDDALYVASYQAIGYLAAKKNDTKSEARKNNSEYAKNESFNNGYDLGKADKYLKQAQSEKRTYVSITLDTGEQSSNDANYYPLDELAVVSYADRNAVIRNYDENNVKNGDYVDLLGQDMTDYIGTDYEVQSLRNFVTDNVESFPDGIYIVSDDYHYIAEITDTQIKQVKAKVGNKIR